MKRNEAFPSKYLKAEDLDGSDLTVTITGADHEEFKDRDGKPDNKPVLHLKGEKSLVLNLTNWKAIEKVLGSDDTDEWKGKQVTLYPTEVDAFGETRLAIRVRLAAPKGSEKAQSATANGSSDDAGATAFWSTVNGMGVSKADALPIAKEAIAGKITWQDAISRLDLPF